MKKKNNSKHIQFQYGHIFNFCIETTMLNSRVVDFEYPDGDKFSEVLFEASKQLPRKKKKYIRFLIGKSKKVHFLSDLMNEGLIYK